MSDPVQVQNPPPDAAEDNGNNGNNNNNSHEGAEAAAATDGTEAGHGGAHAIDAKQHHDGATADAEPAGVVKLADAEGAEESAAPVGVGKGDDGGDEQAVKGAEGVEAKAEDEHEATHAPLSFKADADEVPASPAEEEQKKKKKKKKNKKKKSASQGQEEEGAPAADAENDEGISEPATPATDEPVPDAAHHAEDAEEIAPAAVTAADEPAPAPEATDAAPSAEPSQEQKEEQEQEQEKQEDKPALEEDAATTTVADPPASEAAAEDVQAVDPEANAAHPTEAEPAAKEGEAEAVPPPVEPVVGEPVAALVEEGEKKEDADAEPAASAPVAEETAVPAEEPAQEKKEEVEEEKAAPEPETSAPAAPSEDAAPEAAAQEPAPASVDEPVPEPVVEDAGQKAEDAAPEPAEPAAPAEVPAADAVPEEPAAEPEVPAAPAEEAQPSAEDQTHEPAAPEPEEPVQAVKEEDAVLAVPEPPVEEAHQPFVAEAESHAAAAEDAQPAVEVEPEAPSANVEAGAPAEESKPEEALAAEDTKLEEAPVVEDVKPEEAPAAAEEAPAAEEPKLEEAAAAEPKPEEPAEPTSEWRDDVPTPVEVDEVVVAPQTLLAEETLAAADLSAGNVSDSLDQDVVEDVRAADLSEAAPPSAEEAPAEVPIEGAAAPAQEEEEHLSSHVSGPVASVLASLEDVPTPAVDVAGTPGVAETEAPAMGTSLVVEEGQDEEGQTQEVLAQVLETAPTGTEESSAAIPEVPAAADAEPEPSTSHEEVLKEADAPSVSELDTPNLSVAPSEDSEEPQTPVAAATEDHSEAPQIKVDDEEEGAKPEVVEEEEKRPSRPWTPSYSVTNMGPDEPVEEPVVNEEKPVAAEIQRSASSTSLNAPATTEEPERPKSPWTPSYSVTQQGPGDAAELDALEPLPAPAAPAEGTTSEDTAPLADNREELAAVTEPVEELTSDSTAPPLDDAVPAAEAQVPEEEVVGVSEDTAPASALAAPDAGAEVERPKSPWTPSYSVTQQGPGEPAELDALEQLPEPVAPAEGTTSEDTAPTIDHPDVVAAEVATTDEVTSDATGAPTDALAATEVPERPKSPWTPSYSVTNLQGGTTDEKELEEAEAPVEPSAPSVHVSTEAADQAIPVSENAELERPKSPWTPSYSVTNQGSAQDEKEIAELEQLPPSDLTPGIQAPVPRAATPEIRVNDLPSSSEEKADQEERPKSPWTPSYSVTTLPGETKPEEGVEEAAEAPAPAPTEEQPERPKSPWTPSYSVTNLKGGEQENKEIEELEQLPAPATAEPSSSEETTERPKSPWTPSYSVMNLQGSSQEQKEAEQPELAPEAAAEPAGVAVEEPVDRPKSPWTPSYSVTNLQGGAAEAEELEKQQQLPTPAKTTPAPDSEQVDRPKSPWTPSYSVTNLPEVAETKEAELPVPLVAPAAVPAAPPSIAIPEDQPERPKSPWTPSYSVTSLQGGAPEVEPAQVGEALATAEPSQEVVSEDTAPVQSTPSIQVTDETLGSANEVAVEEPERPKSPWVPSYSVTDQPGSPRQAPKEIEPTPDADTAEPERPKSPWTPSYSVTKVGAGPKEEAELDKLEQLPAPVTAPAPQDNTAELTSDAVAAPELQPSQSGEPERPKSPWTPSYSVTQQGSAQPSETGDKFESLPALSASPPVPTQVVTKATLSTPGVSAKAELSPLDIPSSPRSSRSSRSSRFFPGGWFTPKSPANHDLPSVDEGRPSTSSGSANAEDAGTDKKSRSCLIM